MHDLPRATWRLLLTQSYAGATNMAIDEAIAEAVRAGESLPTVRFYQWQPACLSLGRLQSAESVDFTRCRELGWDVLRRASGGRAVLHIDELTYSITAQESNPLMAGGVMPSYRRLSEGLLAGLAQAGLIADQTQQTSQSAITKGPICFDLPSAYEITYNGRKLIGSAQKRSRGIVLQHGAIPLHGDIARIVDGLQMTDTERASERQRLRSLATTVSAELTTPLDLDRFVRHLVGGFIKKLNISFIIGQLSTSEQALATKIHIEKYANSAWTHRL